MNRSSDLLVASMDAESYNKAKALSEKLSIPLVTIESATDNNHLMLCVCKDGISLCGNGISLKGDFSHMLSRLKPNNLNSELIVKAAKIKSFGNSPIAVDATAGLGEDSFLLAAVGFKVMLYEYNPIISVLLSDALKRASEIPQLSEIVARMKLFEQNSIDALPALDYSPDLILLDPMFPQRQKSGLVKKKLQIIKQLEMPCSDEASLISAALAANPKKIIIKRPANGEYLAGLKPGYSISGNSIRFDCIQSPFTQIPR